MKLVGPRKKIIKLSLRRFGKSKNDVLLIGGAKGKNQEESNRAF